MSSENITWLSLFLSLTAFVIDLFFLIILVRDISRKKSTNSEDINLLISDLLGKVSSVQKQIINQKVELEIIEMKSSRNLSGIQINDSQKLKESQVKKSLIRSEPASVAYVQSRLTNLELEVLNLFSQGAILSASDVQEKVHRTREHTGREMSSLSKRGYLIRDSVSRPFMYRLSELGEKSVGN